MSTMGDRFQLLDRLAPLVGILAVILWVIGIGISESASAPDDDAPATAIAEYFSEESGSILAGSFIFMLGVAAFVWFLGSVRVRYNLAEGTAGRFGAIMFGTGVLTAALAMGMTAPNAAGAFAAENLDRTLEPGAAEALWIVSDGFFIAAEASVVAFFLAAGLGALRFGALPRWLAWASIALGILALFPWVGWAAFIWGLPLWVLVTSVWMFMSTSAPTGSRRARLPRHRTRVRVAEVACGLDEGRHPRRRHRHAAPSADADHEQASPADLRPPDGDVRDRGAREGGRHRAHARDGRDARGRVPAPARERARVRDRPAVVRLPGAGGRDRRGARARGAVRRRRAGRRDARRQRRRGVAPADRPGVRGQERGARILLSEEGAGAPPPPRRARAGRRRPVAAHPREAGDAAEPLRRDRHLLLRRRRLRGDPDARRRPAAASSRSPT